MAAEPPTASSSKYWMSYFKDMTGIGMSADERAARRNEQECQKCEDWKRDLQATSPIVRFLSQHIALLSHPGTSPAEAVPVLCAPCDERQLGGFHPEHGVLICSNRLGSKKLMEDTLAHEMTHLFDERRFKVDWHDLKSHACSEIRAANLSGDCRMMREFSRRNFGVGAQHQSCVRRRAVLSVAMNPSCPDNEAAEKAVDQVWTSCMADTRPFDHVY